MGENQMFEPRLVTSKLLRCMSEFSGLENQTMHGKSLNRQKDTLLLKYKVFASTWNVGGAAPPDHLDLEDWLDTKANSYDIYVLGLQEMVPLNARNVLGPGKSWVSDKWNSLIEVALNKKTRVEVHQGAIHGRSRESFAQEESFRCIMSKRMVGIFASVWAKSGLLPHIRHPDASSVGSGIMGCLGNKGAVSIRFLLHDTSFCFVCCHLASGGKDADVLLRNVGAADVLSRTRFCRGGAAPELPRRILDHDRVVLLGDLNYRISLQDDETRLLVKASKWSILLDNDQLLFEMSEGRHFEGWHEGSITFAPTYKYHPNSNEYYWSVDGAAHDKTRAPAWCDRVLWRGKGMMQIRYERCEYQLSDHRPVRAIFHAQCEMGEGEESLGGFCALR